MKTKTQPPAAPDTSHTCFMQLRTILHFTAGMGTGRVRLHLQLVMASPTAERGFRFVDEAALPFADREER